MKKVRAAPKCRTCGQHPRSGIHRAKCGIAQKPEVVEVDLKVPPIGWVLGKTCLVCRTTYTQTPMPPLQEEGTKNYDTTRQLPGTLAEYPQCAECLSWTWPLVAKRFGVKI